MAGTDETWANIQFSLRAGRRSLPGGLTLAKLLAEQRGVRNFMDLSPLIIKQILAWADAHKEATGDWPNHQCGQVAGADETWSGINASLYRGNRGLPGDSSVAKLLAEHRGMRNLKDLLPLTVEQILAWADAHKAATGAWPNQKSGQVTGTDETWPGINAALNRGNRGLPGGSSLSRLLAEHHHDPR